MYIGYWTLNKYYYYYYHQIFMNIKTKYVCIQYTTIYRYREHALYTHTRIPNLTQYTCRTIIIINSYKLQSQIIIALYDKNNHKITSHSVIGYILVSSKIFLNEEILLSLLNANNLMNPGLDNLNKYISFNSYTFVTRFALYLFILFESYT